MFSGYAGIWEMKQDKGKHLYVSYKNYIVNFENSRCQIILTHKFYPKILSSFVVEEKIMINYWWNFFFFFFVFMNLFFRLLK